MNSFCVIGSLNMDIVTRCKDFPKPGETLSGLSFNIFPGGKGANQAVALAKLGAKVFLVGNIGDDVLGSQYKKILRSYKINTSAIDHIENSPTGTATILVNSKGENNIIVVAGANAFVGISKVMANHKLISSSKSLLLQLEIPIEAVIEAAKIARQHNVNTILDPAPALDLPAELYNFVDIITPNETEASILTKEDTSNEKGKKRAAEILLKRGVKTVIIKSGSQGAYFAQGDSFFRVPGYLVKVVDTVAAGDSFNAGLAYALGENYNLVDAIKFANAVAGLATTKEGAQAAMPSLIEVREFLKNC